MKNSKQATPEATTVPTNAELSSQLGAIEKSVSPIVSLTKKQRGQIEARSANVPDALIEQMIQAATKSGGVVAGIPFDVAAATATLTDVKNARAAATSGRQIAQQMEDDASSKRVVVSDRVFAIYRALGRLVKTPEGNALLRTYESMASTVKNRPRKPRKNKTAAATGAAAPPAGQGTQAATTAPAQAPSISSAPAEAAAPPVPPTATATNGASHS